MGNHISGFRENGGNYNGAIRVANPIWKKKVSDALKDLNIIDEDFTGKIIISFKEGGISYIEKTETLK